MGRSRGWIVLAACLGALIVAGGAVRAGGYGYLYSEILRVDPDGSNLERVLSREAGLAIGHITIDVGVAEKPLYWEALDPFAPPGFSAPIFLRRSGLLGYGIQALGGGTGPIAVDATGHKIYFVARTDCQPCDAVISASLNGTNRQQLYTVGLGVRGLVVDPQGAKLYWNGTSEDQFENRIWTMNLDGSNLQELLVADSGSGMAIDAAAGKLYWAEDGPGLIRRANLDGSGVEDLVSGLNRPLGLAIDPAGDRMWWADNGDGTIVRAGLDGIGPTVVVTGLDLPTGLAFLPTDGGKVYVVANPEQIDPSVPAISTRGAVTLALLLLAGATILLVRRL